LAVEDTLAEDAFEERPSPVQQIWSLCSDKPPCFVNAGVSFQEAIEHLGVTEFDGPQGLEKGEQVPAGKMDRRRGQQEHAIADLTQIP
jgi:hypothetical protein